MYTDGMGVEHGLVEGVMKSLEASFTIVGERTETQFWEITEEGHSIIKNGRYVIYYIIYTFQLHF